MFRVLGIYNFGPRRVLKPLDYCRLYTLMKIDFFLKMFNFDNKYLHKKNHYIETNDTSFESPETALFAFELKHLKIFDVEVERHSCGPSIMHMSVNIFQQRASFSLGFCGWSSKTSDIS